MPMHAAPVAPEEIADRWIARLRASWGDAPPEHVTLGAFQDESSLGRWHPDHTLESHRALTDAMVLRLATLGIETSRFVVTSEGYDRWRGRRPDTPENRARFIGERGSAIPWRFGVKMGRANTSRGAPPTGAAIGWCAFDLDSGWRASESGRMDIE